MKNLKIAWFLMGFALAETQVWAQPAPKTLPRCNVGADPVQADRQPTSDEEVVVNPADHVVRYKSGNGTTVTCRLEAGVPVVVSKTTGLALWVYGCGNDIVSTSWKPKQPTEGWGRVGPVGLTGPTGPQGEQGIPGSPGSQGIAPAPVMPSAKDYKVRSRGHGKRNAVIGAAIIVGTAVAIGNHNNWFRGGTKGKVPGVTTDSVRVTKCIATSYPNNCPRGNRLGGAIIW